MRNQNLFSQVRLVIFTVSLLLLTSLPTFAQVTRTIYQDQFNGTINVDVPDAILSQCNNCKYQNFGGTQAGSAYFYLNHIDGGTGLMFDRSLPLISGVNYSFSMYYKNSFAPVPANYTFSMRNGTAGAVLGSVTRTDFATNSWKQAAFDFVGGASNNVQLSTTSPGFAGGNDNGFDTLVITHTGPTVTISNTATCPSLSTTLSSTLTGSPTHFASPAYQWQDSTDGGTIWNNISGATASTLTVSNLSSSFNNRRYRLLVAQNVAAIASTSHQFISNVINLGTISCNDLTLAKSHTGNFTVGSPGTYSFSVTNSGGIASAGTITVTDTLPTGLTVNGGAAGTVTDGGTNAANWSCSSNNTSPQVITCTSSTAIAAGGTSTFNFSVNVGASTPIGTNSVTNSASVSGGGETNTANNTSNDPTTILSPNLTIAKTDSGASFTVGSTGTYQMTVGNTGTAATSGTITVSDTLPTGLTVPNGSLTLGGAQSANWSCSATSNVITCTSTTAITTSGSSVFTFNVNVGTNAPIGTNSISNTATVSGGGEATANNGNNSNTDTTTVLSPNLTIGKSHTPTTFVRGSTGTYNITVSNSGTASTSGTITVVDTLPTGLSIANGAVTLSGTNSANWSCNAASNVITCTSSTAIATSGSSTFGFNVNVAVNAAATVTNNVTVAGGGEATANSGNNSATDPTATVLPPSFGCSDKGYAIKNAGTIAEFWEIDIATGNSTSLINPIIPSSAGGQGANSIGYNPLDGLIYGKRIGTSEIIRIASDLSVQIIPITGLPTANLFAADVSANGIYYLTRTGYTTIERVDVNPSSPTYMTRLTPINVPAVNYSDIAINPNDGYAYAITDGTAPHSLLRIDLTTGSVTTIGTVTGGGSEAGTNFGSSWMDSNGNLFFNQGANGNTYKIASTHTLSTGAVTSTFVSTTTTGINDGAKCNTSAVVLGPNVSLAKSHTGNFTVGSSGTYSFTVSNTGETATSGTITVTDTLPIGLTVNGGGVGAITEGGTNAANWTCNSAALAGSPAQQTITCTSTTAIATSGISVFSFNVNVGVETAVGTNSITNTATVAGGGEIDTTNNSTSDPTTVLSPDLTIVKSHSGNFTRGSTGVYNITVGNSGTVATSGTITVSDTLPAGLNIADGAMTLGGANSANWTCNAASNVITCTSSTVIAISGSSTFTFTVNVASNAAATVNNTATISGGNEANANNGNNSSIDPTNTISSPPNVVLAKSCTVPSDCTTAPQLPGTDVTYRIAFTNSGGQGASNMTIVDGVPDNTDFKLGSVTTSLGTTGLTIAIEYSNDFNPSSPSSATWTYTPVSGGGGASTGYDRNVKAVRWRVTSGTLSNVSPNNNGYAEFSVKIR